MDNNIKVYTGETSLERKDFRENMMQIKTQYQAAMIVQIPRDEEKILAKLESVARYVGHNFFYLWPIADKRGNVTMISGGTIDLAETIIYYWLNIAIEHDIEDLGNKWKIKHVFIDFERGLQQPRTTIVAKPGNPPGGWDKDRWERMCLNKANSFNLRDLVFTVIPRWMRDKIIDAAKESEMKKASNEIKAGSADNFFIQIHSEYGISKANLMAFLNLTGKIDAMGLFEVKNIYMQLKRGAIKAEQIITAQKDEIKHKQKTKPTLGLPPDKKSEPAPTTNNDHGAMDLRNELIKKIYSLVKDINIPIEAVEEMYGVSSLQNLKIGELDGIIINWDKIKKQFISDAESETKNNLL